MKKLLNVVIGIPCYNEEQNVIATYNRIKKILLKLHGYSFSFLFVDNGSTDNTREKINILTRTDKRVRGVFLSRNFGPEASAAALIDHVRGDAIITLPCDLQDPPELIPNFLKKWKQGNTIVVGAYKKTEDDVLTAFLRKTFYSFFKKLSNIDIPVNASGAGLLDKKAIVAMKALPEKYRFFRGLRAWIGFKSAFVYYNRIRRTKGASSYSFLSYFQHAERGLYGFSYLLLDGMMFAGITSVAIALLSVCLLVLYSIIRGTLPEFNTALIVGIFFFGSIQLLAVGILGKYIQVIVEETKNRPTYIVDAKANAT